MTLPRLILPTGSGGGGGSHPVVLAETVLSSAQTHIEFSGISQSYRHLQVQGRIRSARPASNDDQLLMRVGNGVLDAGASSYSGVMVQNGGLNEWSNARSEAVLGRMPAATATANSWGTCDLMIEDYTGPTLWRVCSGTTRLHVVDTNYVETEAVWHWRNASASIDVVRLYPNLGSFVTGSRLRLIGIPAP